MTSISFNNIQYYQNLLSGYQELAENNEARNEHIQKFLPHNRLIMPISNSIFNLGVGCHKIASALTHKITSVFSDSLAERVQDSWDDPVSTGAIVKIAQIFEKGAAWAAKRAPTTRLSYLGLPYCSQAAISLAQHIHILAKDTQAVFGLPDHFRSLLKNQTSDQMESSLAGRVGIWIKHKIDLGKNSLIILIGKLMTSISPYIPYTGKVANWLEKQVNHAALDVYQNVLSLADENINATEKTLRQWIIHPLAAQATYTGVYFAVNAAFAYGIQQAGMAIADQSGADVADNINRVVKNTGFFLSICLWAACLRPTIKRLHNSYDPKFKTDVSTIEEIHNLFSIRDFLELGIRKGDLNKFVDVVKHADLPMN